ncbi:MULTISPECIES: YxcD family protein [Bacillus]|jgi:hypothetical protein|uniref:DUF2653 domain-containing protein n=1 Tax=Bacillus smithii 7_3_47FAA TaxID=665952 RepID=G9QHT2_9BACI|nr:YxcD family protein [Bacillus smithii]AKP46983.1 hypothetical protein BSM4216_1707 [Bacillus smithii]EHL79279.1 hypothetical protein HMPREF1015_01296 [Bacillus smithii 7_3_47FAA]MED0660917.1 YxcD family protein [Bacillus smithii]MED1421505.1 YxcD family protein [Bacillus smithii]MED1454871.1 YxcD family protein [Bacillus smithii]
METLKLSEQEIINAVCVYVAAKANVRPEDVITELLYDDDTGFGAEGEIAGVLHPLTEPQLIEAIRGWIKSEYQIDPYAAGIQLKLDDHEGIIAMINE